MEIQALFEAVNCINCDVSSVIDSKKSAVDTKKIENPSTLEKIKLEKTKRERKKTETRKTSIDKKEKKAKSEGIITIIDEGGKRDKEKDSIDIQIKGIPESKYGELAQRFQYQKLLDQYKRFLDNYLKEATSTFNPTYDYQQENCKEREFEWGQEVATYSEIKDTIRKIKMNLLLGGWHNAVSPDEKDRYKFWKYCSKFNKVMADVIETSVGSGG
ncbi:hypothetical protein HN695_00730 [Candidatus Woesearchaeota archaeon]|jgi:hypothetical protein|nr:hypothetical protein [Candidatus Woesearchaeota archaeon]MBT5272802.1 hypothetical protein [Candidatus Woesearchaeota archaeon]MBT6040414.1 hypothetical protein [Candidatus Woesearchaeota archaeon]MBT6336953.1 hypothetical protein [Candidatus Woesearchaeota archaeon]MBT7926839.1 hypothetical protein [Candidatus Woesearchaeota archaeon]